MARRLLVTGQQLGNAGARVFLLSTSTAVNSQGKACFTEFNNFAWSYSQHYCYEVGDVGFLNEVFAANAVAPLDKAQPGGGSYWVLCSTHPPGFGVWPNGYQEVTLQTKIQNASSKMTGTIAKSNATNAKVFRAKNLLVWIPTTQLVPFPGVGVPVDVTDWEIDF